MVQSTVSMREAPAGVPPETELAEVAAALAVLDRILAGYRRRDFALRLWDGTSVPANPGEEARFTLVLNRPGALRRMLLPPTELALGEAYLDGDFDIEGDIIAAMRLGDVFENLGAGLGAVVDLAWRVAALPRGTAGDGRLGGEGAASGRRRARLQGAQHSKERDREAIAYHYNVGNDFYGLFLDRRLVYSCAYFPTGAEDLDSAQEANLEHTCRKLRLKPGERLLDIGCGWGALVMYAAERFGVQALGITLSEPQAELANQRIAAAGLADRARVLLLDYRDAASHGPFDKVVSVGMVEHVGKAKLHEYFQAVRRVLRPGGLLLNHGIAAAGSDRTPVNPLNRYVFQRGAFIRKYVFPDGELVPIGDMLSAAERAGLEARDVENWREHYALTLRHWVRRLESHRDEALRLVDERAYRVWRLYMAGCSHAFTTARLSVHQALLAVSDARGRSAVPWSRADIYA